MSGIFVTPDSIPVPDTHRDFPEVESHKDGCVNIWLPHTAYQIKIWNINLEEIGHFKLGEGRVGCITESDLFHMYRSNYFLCDCHSHAEQ